MYLLNYWDRIYAIHIVINIDFFVCKVYDNVTYFHIYVLDEQHNIKFFWL